MSGIFRGRLNYNQLVTIYIKNKGRIFVTKIGRFVDEYFENNISENTERKYSEEINIEKDGLYILTLKELKTYWQIITCIGRSKRNNSFVNVITKMGYRITCTSDTYIVTYDDLYQKIISKKVIEFKTGERIIVTGRNEAIHSFLDKDPNSYSFGVLLGTFFAKNKILPDKTFVIPFIEFTRQTIEEVCKHYNFQYVLNINNTIEIRDMPLLALLKKLFVDDCIPDIFLTMGKTFLYGFLIGYFSIKLKLSILKGPNRKHPEKKFIDKYVVCLYISFIVKYFGIFLCIKYSGLDYAVCKSRSQTNLPFIYVGDIILDKVDLITSYKDWETYAYYIITETDNYTTFEGFIVK